MELQRPKGCLDGVIKRGMRKKDTRKIKPLSAVCIMHTQHFITMLFIYRPCGDETLIIHFFL